MAIVMDEAIWKTYKALGIVVQEEIDKELRCKCPFCGGTKLYINQDNGMFDCKHCGKQGNKYTFINFWYEQYKAATDRKAFSSLSKDRDNIPYQAFESAHLAFNKESKDWIIPIYNKAGSIVSLRLWNKATGILMNLAGCKASLYGEEIIDRYMYIVICEGEWDAIALRWLLESSGFDDVGVVAVPGAMTFKEIWAPMFSGKDVAIMFDNDEAGRNGTKRVIRILKKYTKTKSLKVLKWDESTPEKYDIRDYISQNMRGLKETAQKIFNMLAEPSEEDIVDVGPVKTTFKDVIAEYEKIICMNDDIRNGLLLLFSVVFSNQMKDVPLWMFIVGPSGGGKSMILQSVADSIHAKFVSSMTSATLVSGFDLKGTDPSLLPQLIGKTLILKEFTEILGLPLAEQEKIFDILRGAYDGRVDRIYGNGVVRIYPEPGSGLDSCHFSFVAGVTNVIHGRNRAALGERFLKYQMFEGGEDTRNILEAAVSNAVNLKVPETELKKAASRFIDYKLSKPFVVPTVPEWIQQRIIALAEVVGVIRAHTERETSKGLTYRPVAEVGSRLAKVLIKVCQTVAFTLDKAEADAEVYKLVKRVALDTCYGWHRDVMLQLAQHGELTKNQIADKGHMSLPRAEECLENLLELKAVDFYREHTGDVGAPARRWRLSDKMGKVFEQADILGDDVVEKLPDIPGEYRRAVGDEHRKNPKLAKSPVFS